MGNSCCTVLPCNSDTQIVTVDPTSSNKGNDEGTKTGTFRDEESEYTGSFLGNKKHGFGREKWFSDGSQFEGVYVLGKKNGEGIYRWSDGSLYQGQFTDDVISGKGVYRGAKSVYQGQFLNSRQHGTGIQTWTDGRKYEGEFLENQRSGKGKMIWPDQHYYDGQWLAGQQHGSGLEGEVDTTAVGGIRVFEVSYEKGKRVQATEKK